ncbi:hypothetical protein L210DRAFT_1055911 [Boletus edulis BED1]|uniref:F-box domain-containing protein n=1 Tax=Boletus edulis BED1 TaxID=1328754 RepID=A0AAD4BWH6_BOLED|nr:hypothetical protein L210DRAFT_1055911 [Boletus edulis BED1]
MHHALQIPEVLLSIFGQDIYPNNLNIWEEPPKHTRDLAGLARTCRAFKEPALDVLWSVLEDLSPLARCLSCRKSERGYVFTKPLTQTEWDVLRHYTCRIRAIRRFDLGVDWKSFRVELAPSIPDLLFPNLRYVQCGHRHTKKIGQLPPRQPLPSLLSIEILFRQPALPSLQHCFKWFSELSPSVKRLCAFSLPPPEGPWLISVTSEHICGWRNLQIVMCPNITMDIGVLAHLSRMPALTALCFVPSDTIPTLSDSPFLFSNLHLMEMYPPPSELLSSISRVLAHIQLPAIDNLYVGTPDCPPGGVGSFFSVLETACTNHSITWFSLSCSNSIETNGLVPTSILTFDDVRPMMAFNNLQRLWFDVFWNVGLTDVDLVKLACAWPHLEQLVINVRYGWGTRVVRGITPDGLFHLLQACPSLNDLCLAIDTRGYTHVPPDQLPARLEYRSKDKFSLDFVDSVIEEESVQAMATFVAGIAPRVTVISWGFEGLDEHQRGVPGDWLRNVYKDRWREVKHRADLMRPPAVPR